MLSEVNERIVQAEDVLRRLVVASPQEGIVANIRMRTAGSVIAAGEAILDIVPEREPLIVEAKVDPREHRAIRSRHCSTDQRDSHGHPLPNARVCGVRSTTVNL